MVSLVHGGTELQARAIDVTYLRQRRRLLKQQAELWQMNTAIVGCLCLLPASRHSAVVRTRRNKENGGGRQHDAKPCVEVGSDAAIAGECPHAVACCAMHVVAKGSVGW